MQALRSKFLVSIAALALTACASSGGSDNGIPLPELNSDGSVSQPKNIALTNIGYLHPSASGAATSGRSAKDEDFEVALATMTLDIQTNGGLVLNNASRTTFGEGGTVSFDASTNTFIYDITSVRAGSTDGASYQQTFSNILIADPKDDFLPSAVLATGFNQGTAVGRLAITLSSVPDIFSFVNLPADGSAPAFTGFDESHRGNVNGVISTLETLSVEQLGLLEEYVDNYLAFDYVRYNGTGGVSYNQGQLDTSTPRLYSANSLWVRQTATQLEYGASVFGIRTPSFDMPTTGTARYIGSLGGYLFRQNTATFMTGGAIFDVNFATNRADFQLNPAVQETGAGGEVVFQAYEDFVGVAV
ncbi:MAG: hypothetical protein V3V30_03555, partial [Parvularculaceae bacterium]